MTGKIEVDLKRLQDEGTIEPVQLSERAAPISKSIITGIYPTE